MIKFNNIVNQHIDIDGDEENSVFGKICKKLNSGVKKLTVNHYLDSDLQNQFTLKQLYNEILCSFFICQESVIQNYQVQIEYKNNEIVMQISDIVITKVPSVISFLRQKIRILGNYVIATFKYGRIKFSQNSTILVQDKNYLYFNKIDIVNSTGITFISKKSNSGGMRIYKLIQSQILHSDVPLIVSGAVDGCKISDCHITLYQYCSIYESTISNCKIKKSDQEQSKIVNCKVILRELDDIDDNIYISSGTIIIYNTIPYNSNGTEYSYVKRTIQVKTLNRAQDVKKFIMNYNDNIYFYKKTIKDTQLTIISELLNINISTLNSQLNYWTIRIKNRNNNYISVLLQDFSLHGDKLAQYININNKNIPIKYTIEYSSINDVFYKQADTIVSIANSNINNCTLYSEKIAYSEEILDSDIVSNVIYGTEINRCSISTQIIKDVQITNSILSGCKKISNVLCQSCDVNGLEDCSIKESDFYDSRVFNINLNLITKQTAKIIWFDNCEIKFLNNDKIIHTEDYQQGDRITLYDLANKEFGFYDKI